MKRTIIVKNIFTREIMYYLDYRNSFSVLSHIKLTSVESYFIHYFSQISQTCPKSYFINKCNYGVRLIMITFRNFPTKNKIYRNKFRILCFTYYCISFLYFCLKDIKLQLQNAYWFSAYHCYKRNMLRYSASFFISKFFETCSC